MDTTLPGLFPWYRRQTCEQADTRTDPPSHPISQPVFIYDAITPWRGETLLSVRLREDLEAAIEQANSRQD